MTPKAFGTIKHGDDLGDDIKIQP
ncbi:unnamed protein product, partial [Didymodactylos carnosus]